MRITVHDSSQSPPRLGFAVPVSPTRANVCIKTNIGQRGNLRTQSRGRCTVTNGSRMGGLSAAALLYVLIDVPVFPRVYAAVRRIPAPESYQTIGPFGLLKEEGSSKR